MRLSSMRSEAFSRQVSAIEDVPNSRVGESLYTWCVLHTLETRLGMFPIRVLLRSVFVVIRFEIRSDAKRAPLSFISLLFVDSK